MSAFVKDILREIKYTRGRFLSLLIITALGAVSIVGIQAASTDMRLAADASYKAHRLYDLQIKSTLGFDKDDIAALRDAAGVSAVMPTTIFDVYLGIGDAISVARTYALPEDLNTIDLVQGELPRNASECVVEENLARDGGYGIGSVLSPNLDDKADYDKVFGLGSFTVVGIVTSPLYLSFQRGHSTLGDGAVRYFLYLHPDAYALDVFTDAYLAMDGSRETDNLSKSYDNAAEDWKRQLKQVGEAQTRLKAEEIANARREVDEGWREYNDGVRELNEKVAEARQKLGDAAIELADAKVRLDKAQRTLRGKISRGQQEIDGKRLELESAQAQLNAQRAMLEETGAEGSPAWDALLAAQAQLDAGAQQLARAQQTLDDERAKAQRRINDGRAQYRQGLADYEDGLATLDREEAETRQELAEARQELQSAHEKLKAIPEPEWFVLTRKDGVSFDSYYQDTLRLQKIGYIFPLVFFLVAVMVSLTSMSRMIEERRTQIGIYQALGYRPRAIMAKYFIYSFSASLLGGVLGVFVGSLGLPHVLFEAYGHLYEMPPILTPVPVGIGLLAVTAAVASVVGVTLLTCVGSLTTAPAQLMRPKAPPAGKRVLLERIPFVWNRLRFSGKVTARNIFRYKKRFLMTLVGVAGCCALLLTGFGLRDSISGVAPLQYGTITTYDVRAYLKEITTQTQREELSALLPAGSLFIREESADAAGKAGGLPVSLIVPEQPGELSRYINLALPLEDGSVLVTDKLARVMGVAAGDSFAIIGGDGRSYEARVTGVVENYVLHYVYLSPQAYAKIMGGPARMNSVLTFSEDAGGLAETLLRNDNVRAVVNMDDIWTNLRHSTNALRTVTVVLVVLACCLALVVLFNLTNINISERVRELATLKVLGFQDEETAMYVYRENGLVTFMGIVLGLVAGVFLHRYVLVSAEIDLLKFPHIIHFQSYVYAAALSLAFGVFVNLVMNRKLKKIDMVESLKNVE